MTTKSTIPNEAVERAAHAMYADVEVGEWEDGDLDTLLAYRRAARIALDAVPRIPDDIMHDRIATALAGVGITYVPQQEADPIYDRLAAAVLALLSTEETK